MLILFNLLIWILDLLCLGSCLRIHKCRQSSGFVGPITHHFLPYPPELADCRELVRFYPRRSRLERSFQPNVEREQTWSLLEVEWHRSWSFSFQSEVKRHHLSNEVEQSKCRHRQRQRLKLSISHGNHSDIVKNSVHREPSVGTRSKCLSWRHIVLTWTQPVLRFQ